MLKKLFVVLGAILGVILILFLFILFKTFNGASQQVSVEAIEPAKISTEAVAHLQQAIRYQTVSYDRYANFDSTTFRQFVQFLQQTYPLCDSILHLQTVNEFGLLYTWKGSNENLKPAVFLGHYDVVPVPKETLEDWNAEPFSGTLKEGFIWGRGSLDDKLTVIGLLEATELLLAQGFKPDRSLLFAFGFDEEIGGAKGAKALAELLEQKGIEPEFVLDEGLVITQNMVPGITKPVALIGTAQKGYLTLGLTARMEGGHSSMPGPENALTVVSTAVNKLQANPFPAEFCPPVEAFLDRMGPEMPFVNRMAFANRWLFSDIIQGQYAKSHSGSALIRTTTAPTMLNSGIKENVIPPEARAIVNFRILPGHTRESITEEVRQLIADDRVEIEVQPVGSDPSPVADLNGFGFVQLEKSIRQVYPEALVAPSLVLATTDARHFAPICKNIYYFMPVTLTSEDLEGIHGTNERVKATDFEQSIRFYLQLIKNCQQSS